MNKLLISSIIFLVVLVLVVIFLVLRIRQKSSSNKIYVLPPGEWVELNVAEGGGPGACYLIPPGYVEGSSDKLKIGDPYEPGQGTPEFPFVIVLFNDFEDSSQTEEQVYASYIGQIQMLNPLPGSIVCIKLIPKSVGGQPPSTDATYYKTFSDARFYYVKGDGTIVQSEQKVSATWSQDPSKSSPDQDPDLASVPRFSFFFYKDIVTDPNNNSKKYYVFL